MKLLELANHCKLPLFILTLFTNSLSGQKHFDINLAHNWNFLDRDIEVSVERFRDKIGIKAGLNLFQHTAQESLHWERPYAANFGQRIGFHTAFMYRAPLPNSNVEFSPFVKLAAFFLSNKRQSGENNATVSEGYLQPSTSVGIQVKAKLCGRLMVFGGVEAGALWGKGDQQYSLSGQQNFYFNGLATGGTVGLGWRLKK